MEQEKRRPWRRWVVLVLMIVGFVAGGIFVPVQPEITVAAEKLFDIQLPWGGTFAVVNTLPTLVVTLFLVILPLAWATRNSLKKSAETDLVPRGIGNMMEAFFEMLYNLTESSAGAKWARAIFPWFATIMFYVLIVNLLKLIPGFESIGVLHPAEHGAEHVSELHGWHIFTPELSKEYILAPFFRGGSVDLNFTFAIALISVFMTQVIGFQAQGFGYLSKFFNVKRMFKVPFFGAMDFLVGLLELISEISKIISFAFRLFGNMFAGIVLVVIVAGLLGKISILPAMIMLFELFVGVIQAFVFGMLTMVFMAQVTQSHDGEHAEEAH